MKTREREREIRIGTGEKKCMHVKYVNMEHIKNLGNTISKYISPGNQYYRVRVLSLKSYVHKHAN